MAYGPRHGREIHNCFIRNRGLVKKGVKKKKKKESLRQLLSKDTMSSILVFLTKIFCGCYRCKKHPKSGFKYKTKNKTKLSSKCLHKFLKHTRDNIFVCIKNIVSLKN